MGAFLVLNARSPLIENPQLNSQDIEHKQNSARSRAITLLKITCIRYNMDLEYINACTKCYQNSSICSEDIEEKHIFT